MAPQEHCETKNQSRKERMTEHNEKCERILHYLLHGKHQDGLTKNQQRVVRGQAKKYRVDESSMLCFTTLLSCNTYILKRLNIFHNTTVQLILLLTRSRTTRVL